MKFYIGYIIAVVLSGCIAVYCFTSGNILLGCLCSAICFVLLFAVVYYSIDDAKKLGQNNKDNNQNESKQQKTNNNSDKKSQNKEEFAWLDGKTDDLSLDEVTDIEELLEDDEDK